MTALREVSILKLVQSTYPGAVVLFRPRGDGTFAYWAGRFDAEGTWHPIRQLDPNQESL